MTKLEPHRCDFCDVLIYLPENSIHTLEIDRTTSDILEWELCYKCYGELLTWIASKQEEEKK